MARFAASSSTARSPQSAKPLPQVLQELWELLRDYARQETVDPLRDLGRYVGFGLAGSVILTFGSGMIALGLLRALQTQTGSTFVGAWSFAPYLIVVVVLAIVAGAAIGAAGRDDNG